MIRTISQLVRTERKIHIFAFLLSCFASVVLAETFTTSDGKEYKNVRLSRVEPDGIVVMTNSGILKIYFTELPKAVQQRFHYDAAKAAAYSSDQAAKQDALQKQRSTTQVQRDFENEVARSKAAAIARYPDAGKRGSALDREIQEGINWIQKNQPDLFQDPTWPMHVTEIAAQRIAAPQAQQTASPSPATMVAQSPSEQSINTSHGTMLDQRPGGQSVNTSHGTMLDQRPSGQSASTSHGTMLDQRPSGPQLQLYGTVIDVTDEGLLISVVETNLIGTERIPDGATVFIAGKFEGFYNEDKVQAVGNLVGAYQYTTVIRSRRTARTLVNASVTKLREFPPQILRSH